MVLGLTASASAANDIVWTNADESNSSWCNGDNWDGDTQPGSSDTAWINQIPQTPESGNPTVYSPNRGPVVPIGCSPTVGYIEGPDPCFGNIQVMDINTDGTFYIKNDWTWQGGVGTAIININGTADVDIDGVWRGTDNGISIINIDDNPTITVGGDFRAADESGELYFNMSGGYFNVQGEFLLGDNGGGAVNVSGGSLIVDGEFNMGGLRGAAPINVNVSGGFIQIKDVFRLPGCASRGGNIRLNLYGGVVDTNSLVHGGTDEGAGGYTDDWRIDIERYGCQLL